jgi:hypothetical protein
MAFLASDYLAVCLNAVALRSNFGMESRRPSAQLLDCLFSIGLPRNSISGARWAIIAQSKRVQADGHQIVELVGRSTVI